MAHFKRLCYKVDNKFKSTIYSRVGIETNSTHSSTIVPDADASQPKLCNFGK